jgi:hypothetical protein
MVTLSVSIIAEFRNILGHVNKTKVNVSSLFSPLFFNVELSRNNWTKVFNRVSCVH